MYHKACVNKAEQNHGPRITWDAEGRMLSKQRYENGNPTGEWLEWNSDGKLETRTVFQNDIGSFTTYYPNGSTLETGQIHGRLNKIGEWKDFYANGKPRIVGTYHEGEKDKLWQEWDENGTLKREREYKVGRQMREKAGPSASWSNPASCVDGKDCLDGQYCLAKDNELGMCRDIPKQCADTDTCACLMLVAVRGNSCYCDRPVLLGEHINSYTLSCEN